VILVDANLLIYAAVPTFRPRRPAADRDAPAVGNLVGLPELFDWKLASGGEWGRVSPSQEVAMRPPEVFVRDLSVEEGARLKSISRRAKYQSKRQRAMILLASSTGMSAPQIAGLVGTDESHVRKVIHAFNEQGFDSLDPDYFPRING